jgi:hypothetical protein
MAESTAKNWMVRIGNFVEDSIAKGISDLGQEAPCLLGEPQEKVWYKLSVPEGKCADGYIDYVKGANIAGFMKVATAMLEQGII